jgi:SAM-dependent methyltransferase
MKGSVLSTLAMVVASYVSYYWLQHVSWYQISTSVRGVWDLIHLPEDEIEACARAYEYMIDTSNVADKSDTAVETEHVRAYYQVINRLLAIADIEKMYIPPQLDPKKGLFENQKLVEKYVFSMLGPNIRRPDAVLLDMGCGRGRISQHATRETGAKVRGYNIDESQINNAIEYANQTGMASRLDFRVGDHHQPLPYADASFDGAYSFQAVWPFFKLEELDAMAQEMYRVLKPGASYSCSEYLLNPAFDYNDKEHMQVIERGGRRGWGVVVLWSALSHCPTVYNTKIGSKIVPYSTTHSPFRASPLLYPSSTSSFFPPSPPPRAGTPPRSSRRSPRRASQSSSRPPPKPPRGLSPTRRRTSSSPCAAWYR